jgi:hypothetical protein
VELTARRRAQSPPSPQLPLRAAALVIVWQHPSNIHIPADILLLLIHPHHRLIFIQVLIILEDTLEEVILTTPLRILESGPFPRPHHLRQLSIHTHLQLMLAIIIRTIIIIINIIFNNHSIIFPRRIIMDLHNSKVQDHQVRDLCILTLLAAQEDPIPIHLKVEWGIITHHLPIHTDHLCSLTQINLHSPPLR